MHNFLNGFLLILLFFVCAAPCAALSIETSGGTAGQAVIATLDEPAFVTFQMDGGVPVYGYGTEVSFIPAATGTLSITAMSGGQMADASVTVVASGGGGGSGGGDDPSVVWKTITLSSGTFNVTADNSGETYPVSWQSALGVLQAAGISFKVSDKWETGLFVIEVDGKPNKDTAGWMYQVNGVTPAVTAENKPVSVDDKVIWYYSESMDQTPEQSPRALFYKVQASSAPVSDVSSKDTGENETDTGTVIAADAVSYPLSLPSGSDLSLSEGRMYLTVNVPQATAAGDVITFEGNTMLITRDDVVLKIRFVDFTDDEGIIAGEIEDVLVETTPVTVTCASGATPEIGLIVSLMTVPMDADIDVIVTQLSDLSAVPEAMLRAGNTALGAEGLAVGTVGWQMYIEKHGLENGVDVGDVTVRITTDPARIAQAGGLSAFRLVHILDNGNAEVLSLRSVGTTEDGDTILETGPATGLSSFLFVSVTDVSASPDTVTATTTSTGDTTTPVSTESGAPLPAVCAAVAGILGVTVIYQNRKW